MSRSLLRTIYERLGRFGIVAGAHPNDDGGWGSRTRHFLRKAGQFFKTVYKESMQDRIPMRSSGLTYASMLTLIPVLIIVFNLFQLFGGAEWFDEQVRPFILANLAPGTGEQVATRLEEIVANAGGATLNGIGVLLLVFAVWSIFSGIEGTVNAIWGTRSKAGSLSRIPLYWGLITIVPILLVGSLAITTYIQTMPIVTSTVETFGIGQRLLNRALSVGLVVIGLFLLYQFVPNTPVRKRYALAGAAICGLLHEGLKTGFIFYTTNLVQYNVIYGSLAAIPMLLIWINLSWILVLAGVEMVYVLQHFPSLHGPSKSVRLSVTQRKAVAYRLLVDVTRAFQGERNGGRIRPERWAMEQQLPPGLAERAAETLVEGGFVEWVGDSQNEVLLSRSPEIIELGEIDDILLGEHQSEWPWPEQEGWSWMQTWLDRRKRAAWSDTELATLADLVRAMDEHALPAQDTEPG